MRTNKQASFSGEVGTDLFVLQLRLVWNSNSRNRRIRNHVCFIGIGFGFSVKFSHMLNIIEYFLFLSAIILKFSSLLPAMNTIFFSFSFSVTRGSGWLGLFFFYFFIFVCHGRNFLLVLHCLVQETK